MSGENHPNYGKKRPEHSKKLKGRKHPKEFGQKISKSKIGHIVSESTREKISKSKLGKNNPFYGKTHSEETKEKLRKKAIGRKLSTETKEKLRKKAIGRKYSAEMCEKMSKAQCGIFWWNNGTKNCKAKECPGPEWKRGRIKNKSSGN